MKKVFFEKFWRLGRLKEMIKGFLKREGKHVAIFTVLMTAVIIFYFVSKVEVAKAIDLEHLAEDDYSFVFQVDSVNDDGKSVVLNGWAFKLNQNSTEDDIDVLLYDMEEEKIVYPKMKDTVREDVNQYFLCEYNYSNSGFTATVSLKKVDLKNKDYEVLISVKDTKKVYQTGTYLSKGELMYANPKEFVPLDVAGTDLEQIVNEGVLRAYKENVGMYVYQYEGNLYWIAGPEYAVQINERTYNPLHFTTTQPQLLPEHRREYKFDNQDFLFVKSETFMNSGQCRVVKIQLPVEYSISSITTGDYVIDSGWKWNVSFRPWYSFEN